MKIFIDIERNHFRDFRKTIIVNEFDDEQHFKSVILHVIAIFAKFNFDVLICSFDLIIDFETISNEKIAFNVQTFTEEFSNDNHELKISVKRNEDKKIINFEHVINQNVTNDFRRNTFVSDSTKSIMTLFRQFIDKNANDVFLFDFEQIDNEIYSIILLPLNKYRRENQ